VFNLMQEWLLFVIAVAAFGAEIFALIHALRHSNETFYSAGKRNKAFWTAILGAAVALGFLTLPPPLGSARIGALGFLGIAALVAALVYLVDVKPALERIHPPGKGRGASGPTSTGGW